MKKTIFLLSLIIYTFSAQSMEINPGKMFSLVYQSPFSFLLRKLLTHSWGQALVGHYMNSRISKVHINSFIKAYNIDMSEVQEETYKSFNDFFIRKLKPEARPIEPDINSIISPCDGAITVMQSLSKSTEFLVKGKPFNLEQFLAHGDLAHEYENGTIILIYLGPWNYHRFHFPVHSMASAVKRIQGHYDSVHPFIYTLGIQPLVENERHQIILYPYNQEPFLLIPVGALFVGAIHETYKPFVHYAKGDEMGYFAFGGSTIVMLFKKDTITLRQDLTTSHFTVIRMGEVVATFNNPIS